MRAKVVGFPSQSPAAVEFLALELLRRADPNPRRPRPVLAGLLSIVETGSRPTRNSSTGFGPARARSVMSGSIPIALTVPAFGLYRKFAERWIVAAPGTWFR